jgi:hypothetical protein
MFWLRTELAGVLVAEGAALAALGMKVCEECPSLARPAGVGERVVAVPLLVGQLRIAELDRPLLDVEAELRIGNGSCSRPPKSPTNATQS